MKFSSFNINKNNLVKKIIINRENFKFKWNSTI